MPSFGGFNMGNMSSSVKRKRPRKTLAIAATAEIEEDFLIDFVKCTLEPPER